MKKIGILAIGAMMFLSLSCKKSTIEPEATYYEKPAQNINNNVAPPVKNAISDPIIDENARVPMNGIVNENETPTTYNPNKTPVKGVRNDENVNPYTTTDRWWIAPPIKNENEYPVDHNPEKTPIKGVRNDENINHTNSNL